MEGKISTSVEVFTIVASKAPVYTRYSLLVADVPQAPISSTQLRPMHKPPVASADLLYWAGKGRPAGPALGARTVAVGAASDAERAYRKAVINYPAGGGWGVPRCSVQAKICKAHKKENCRRSL